MLRGTLLAGCLALCVLSCAACDQKAAKPVVSSSSISSSFWSSDEDAESAAKGLYGKYLAVSDQISEDGGRGVERLAPYVTKAELEQERKGAVYLQENGLRVTGLSKLLKFKLQSADLATGRLVAYTCVDFGSTKVLNESGKDVTPADRKDRQTSVAKFVVSSRHLVLAEVSAWSGEPLC